MRIVVDSNVLFSGLLSPSNHSRKVLFQNDWSFYSCNFIFVEIFKHKEKIQRFSSLSHEILLESLFSLLSQIQLVNSAMIPQPIIKNAYDLCKDIDPKDTPFVALTIFLNATLLTGDKKLVKGLKEKGFDQITSLNEVQVK